MGGNLITKDISQYFGIIEADAERIKREYGQAVAEDDHATVISVTTTDKKELRIIPPKEFYDLIAARQREICENVLARLKEMTGEKESVGLKHALRSGVFIAGNATRLRRMDDLLSACLGMSVNHVSSIRRDLAVKGVQPDMTPDNLSIGLLIQGDRNYINCSAGVTKAPGPIFAPPQPSPAPTTTPPAPQPAPPTVRAQPEPEPPKPAVEEVRRESTEETANPKKASGFLKKIGKKIGKKIEDGMQDIFDNADQ